MDTGELFLISSAVMVSVVMFKKFLRKMNSKRAIKGASNDETENGKNGVVVNLEKKSQMVDKPMIQSDEMANTLRKPTKRNTSNEESIVMTKKPKSSAIAPKINIDQFDDVMNKSPQPILNTVVKRSKRYTVSPQREKSQLLAHQPKSPLTLSAGKKPFSPSKFNKTMSVAEIIEGWPFKSPMKRSNDKNKKPMHPVVNASTKTISKKLDVPVENEHDKENQWNDVSECKNPTMKHSTSSEEERYPKSLYISPFTITGRRPINSRKML